MPYRAKPLGLLTRRTNIAALFANRSPLPFRMSSSSALVSAESTKKAEQKYQIIQKFGDFEKKQANRTLFDHDVPITTSKQPDPEWSYGQGLNRQPTPGEQHVSHREIDPYGEGRPMVSNYRLLVSGIAPRPIGFLSTVSGDNQTKNLSPFSYFQVIDHDPPMFVVGFSSRPGRVKDTYRNLKETGECVINTVSENMVEAVNASSIDAPYGISEWDVSGLHEAPSATVKASRVQESVFSIEGKVVDIKEFTDHQQDGMSIASLVLIKATRFWVQEDAVNEAGDDISLDKLRPVGQLGGISYGRITSTFELPRKRWDDEHPNNELLTELNNRHTKK